MIAADGLELRAGQRTLIHDAHFECRAGEFVAVLGANGAGKTTLLRALSGTRRPDGGRVTIDGADVRSLHAAERARRIAHIAAEELFIEQLSVRDVVAAGRYAHHRWWEWREDENDERAISAALESVRMHAFKERPFATLSSGERQRIWIAMALAQEAAIVLLDEPTSHLDLRAAHDILTLLRELARQGKTIVCVLHDVNEASLYADRVMVIGDGTVLAFDKTNEILESAVLERAFGIPMDRARAEDGAIRIFPRRNSE